MKAPNTRALRGLLSALSAAAASPAGGDFTEEGLEDVDKARLWLESQMTHRMRVAAYTVKRQVFRVYCDGREFGADYSTRDKAQTVANDFAKDWPMHKYVVHAVNVRG